jgi:gliding motility-associated-like protein
MMKKSSLHLLSFILFILMSTALKAQITAPGSTSSDQTNYPVFQEIDSIYIFCTDNEVTEIATLRATTQLQGTKTFLWEKYNNLTASFEFYFSESSDGQTSDITGLANGCYRVTITLGGTTETYRAWVFNNWISASGSVTDSDCESFKLVGTFLTGTMKYYDLADNTELEVFKDMKVEWKDGDATIATVISPQIYDPPAKNTDYTFTAYDRFGCSFLTMVPYESMVTKASFTATPMQGEAPLEVTFTNTSENADANQYEWFFFRDLDEIKREAENSQQPIDSIMLIAYDESPVYTYNNTGTYMVKLVAKKVSEFQTCVDTFYMEDYIHVDSSFIAAPNVFTPNGDGTNDLFVVKFWSMKNIKISIFNRWGKKVHYWDKSDIQGFENTWEEAVWDGKMGGRYASPGVYYYVVEGTGRDGKKRRAHGFFHLFRDKG